VVLRTMHALPDRFMCGSPDHMYSRHVSYTVCMGGYVHICNKSAAYTTVSLLMLYLPWANGRTSQQWGLVGSTTF
jgi:hypothetical protein